MVILMILRRCWHRCTVHAINRSWCCQECEKGGPGCILCFMAARGKNSHRCTPWFKDLSAKRDAKDFRPINPTVEVALLGINWKKNRDLVDRFGFPERYFAANFGEVDFKNFCICRAGRAFVVDLAKSQGVQLPAVENKEATSGTSRGQDWNRTCQVCKAKGGSGIKKAAQMGNGYMDPSDHGKGRWCKRCKAAVTNRLTTERKKAAAAAEPEAAAPNLAATAAPPGRGRKVINCRSQYKRA